MLHAFVKKLIGQVSYLSTETCIQINLKVIASFYHSLAFFSHNSAFASVFRKTDPPPLFWEKKVWIET